MKYCSFVISLCVCALRMCITFVGTSSRGRQQIPYLSISLSRYVGQNVTHWSLSCVCPFHEYGIMTNWLTIWCQSPQMAILTIPIWRKHPWSSTQYVCCTICLCACAHACVCVYICTCMCVCVCVCTYVHAYVCVCEYICTCMCVCALLGVLDLKLTFFMPFHSDCAMSGGCHQVCWEWGTYVYSLADRCVLWLLLPLAVATKSEWSCAFAFLYVFAEQAHSSAVTVSTWLPSTQWANGFSTRTCWCCLWSCT